MPNTKKHTVPWSETGKTVYCIIRREIDGYYLNDADGAFADAPADPYVALTEDGTIKGLYELSESRAAWNDGYYFWFTYRQTGVTRVPASDMLIYAYKMSILGDAEVDMLARAYEIVNNKMTIVDATGVVALRNVADSATVATGSITDDSTTTTRAGLTWA